MLGIGAGERVHDVEVLALEAGDDPCAQSVEALLGELAVDVAPPDPLLRARLTDDELVRRRAAGVAAGVDDERAALGEPAVADQEGVRVEHGGGRIPVDATHWVDAVLVEPDRPAQLLPLGGQSDGVASCPPARCRRSDSRRRRSNTVGFYARSTAMSRVGMCALQRARRSPVGGWCS